MSSERITLIGGQGFVGTRLASILRDTAGTDVSMLDQIRGANSGDMECDVTDRERLLAVMPPSEWVINLAAVHHDNVRPISRYYDVNVQGARNICDACRKMGVQRQVFVSSVAVYGDTQGKPCTESTLHRPFNDYGRSKSQAEVVYGEWYAEDSSRQLIIIRPTVIFGEGNRGNLYNLMNSIAQQKFRMVGHGNVVKSIAYVENVASFIPFVMRHCKPGMHVFNYADKPDPTTKEIVSVIRGELGLKDSPLPYVPYGVAYLGGMAFDFLGRLTPVQSPISAQRVKKFCTATPVDTARAVELGFQPVVPVMDALRRTVRHEFLRRES